MRKISLKILLLCAMAAMLSSCVWKFQTDPVPHCRAYCVLHSSFSFKTAEGVRVETNYDALDGSVSISNGRGKGQKSFYSELTEDQFVLKNKTTYRTSLFGPESGPWIYRWLGDEEKDEYDVCNHDLFKELDGKDIPRGIYELLEIDIPLVDDELQLGTYTHADGLRVKFNNAFKSFEGQLSVDEIEIEREKKTGYENYVFCYNKYVGSFDFVFGYGSLTEMREGRFVLYVPVPLASTMNKSK